MESAFITHGALAVVTSVQLTDEEIADLRALTKQTKPSQAVRVAMHEYVRYARRIQLKRLSGRVEMMDNWEELEQAELDSQHGNSGLGAD